VRDALGVHQLGDAEVEQLDLGAAAAVVAHEHVGRLEVAMDDALEVRGLEGVAHLGQDVEHLG
jgi:hypothetical protein